MKNGRRDSKAPPLKNVEDLDEKILETKRVEDEHLKLFYQHLEVATEKKNKFLQIIRAREAKTIRLPMHMFPRLMGLNHKLLREG